MTEPLIPAFCVDDAGVVYVTKGCIVSDNEIIAELNRFYGHRNTQVIPVIVRKHDSLKKANQSNER